MEEKLFGYTSNLNGDFSWIKYQKLEEEFNAAKAKLAPLVDKWNRSGQNDALFGNFCDEKPFIYLFHVFKQHSHMQNGQLVLPGWFCRSMPPEFRVSGGCGSTGAAGEAGLPAGAAGDAGLPASRSAATPRAALLGGRGAPHERRKRGPSRDSDADEARPVSQRIVDALERLAPTPRDEQQQRLVNEGLEIKNAHVRAACLRPAPRLRLPRLAVKR